MPTYHLYTFYASSCAARVLIAAHFKGLDLKHHFIDMGQDEHETEEYRETNPSGAIPTLVIESDDGAKFVLTQSIAILEYFEEQYPNLNPLLPSLQQPQQRARVRELQNIITNDVFPPTNSRIAMRVRAIRGERADQINFVQQVMNEGFTAYETMLKRDGGDYSVGNQVTFADVCLVPALEQAKFYQLDLSPFPLITAIYDRLMQLEAFQKGSWRAQGDTPVEHRVSH
jgi:maleylacetoacetate isomerase